MAVAKLDSYAADLETLGKTAPTEHARRTITKVVALLRGETYLTTGQARDRLGLGSINTVKRLAEDGHLKGAVKNEKGTWQIPLSAVIALEDDRREAAAASLAPSKAIRVANRPSSRLPR